MLRIFDCSLESFRENIKEKKLYIWGGGNRAELCYKEWGIKENVAAIENVE